MSFFFLYTLRENLKILGIALPLHMDCNHVFDFNLEVKIVKKKKVYRVCNNDSPKELSSFALAHGL